MTGSRVSRTGRAWHIAATLAGPPMRLWLLHRLRRGKEIPSRMCERRGIECEPGARPPGKLLWMHAASVGESNAVLPVLQQIARNGCLHILLTTGTEGSANLLARRLPELGLTAAVTHRMAPLDVPSWIERFLRVWQPDAAVFVESELWPNMLAALRRRGTPTGLINARLSERSARSWSRAPRFFAEILGGFATIRARSDEDAARIAALGGRIDAVGDLKAAAGAAPFDHDELDAVLATVGHRPRWLAASTHPGEEEIVAAAHAVLEPTHPGLLTIIAPRHPQRGEAVAALLGSAPRRALGDTPSGTDRFWVCDTLGDMELLYRLVPAVFIGRSLSEVAVGGQNPLEAARLGRAIATGPRTENFKEIVAALRAATALTVVVDAPELAAWVGSCLDDPAAAAAVGARAQALTSVGTDLIEDTTRVLLALAGA